MYIEYYHWYGNPIRKDLFDQTLSDSDLTSNGATFFQECPVWIQLQYCIKSSLVCDAELNAADSHCSAGHVPVNEQDCMNIALFIQRLDKNECP